MPNCVANISLYFIIYFARMFVCGGFFNRIFKMLLAVVWLKCTGFCNRTLSLFCQLNSPSPALRKGQLWESFLEFPPQVVCTILYISFLVTSRYDRECTLTQLAWRQWTQCCPFLSAVRIKLKTLPCIDSQPSLCLGVAGFDKLFASPTSFISKTVLVWLNARLFFVIPSDGKWTRDILTEWVRRLF